MKNEVIVLGTIHDNHLHHEEYSLQVLKDVITTINPDYILAEIPPASYDKAVKEWEVNKKISEPRVAHFPEYTEVIFPLLDTLDFEIIPASGWTKELADYRSQQLYKISQDPKRADKWNRYVEAANRSNQLMEEKGNGYDILWINSDEYDEILEIQMSEYNKFNDDLGDGGWDNINQAHYSHIEKAIDKYKDQGKRFLITFGAGHKGWFVKKLKERNDITLLGLLEVL